MSSQIYGPSPVHCDTWWKFVIQFSISQESQPRRKVAAFSRLLLFDDAKHFSAGARRPIYGIPQAPVTRSECVCSVLNISGLAPTFSSASRETFEGAGLVLPRHHPQRLRGMRMRNLARDASTEGGMIQQGSSFPVHPGKRFKC